MGYTKGPWILKREPYRIAVESDDTIIFEQYLSDEDDEYARELESGALEVAHIVKAAPYLLEALEMSPHMLHTFQDGSDCHCSQCEFVRLRNAAIKRAKGEAE